MMKENWNRLLHSSLGDLARGKTSDYVMPGFWTSFWSQRRARPMRAPGVLKQLHVFYIINLLARIVRSNAPLAPGLLAASASAPSWMLGKSLHKLSHDVEHGFSLAQAVRRQPKMFPPLYADLVEAGEQTGALEDTLNRIMEDMTAKDQASHDTKKLLVYFSVMLMAFAAFAFFLNVKVMPVFFEIAWDVDVPADYKPYGPFLLAQRLTDYAHPLVIAPLIVGIVLFLLCALPHPGRLFYRAHAVRRALSETALRIPLVRRLIKNRNLAKSLTIFAQLTEAGFPLDDALDHVVRSDISPTFSHVFGRVCNRIRKGTPLTQALQSEEPFLPKSLAVAAANAEFHGDLPGALRNLAEFYHKKSMKQTKMITPLLMPVLILTLGALVFSQYFSVFAAIINMSEMIMGGM